MKDGGASVWLVERGTKTQVLFLCVERGRRNVVEPRRPKIKPKPTAACVFMCSRWTLVQHVV